MLEPTSTLGPYGRITYGLAMATLSFASVVGYSIYLRAIWGDRGLQKRSIFLMSLCVADLFLIFGHIVGTIIASFSHTWPFGDMGCQINAYFGMGPSLVGIGCITLISFDTYFRECKKEKYCVNYGFYIALVWISGMVAGLLPVVGLGSYGFESKLHLGCLLEFNDRNNGIVSYVTLISLVWFAYPMYKLFKYYGMLQKETGNNVLLKVVPTQMLCSWTPYAASSMLILVFGASNLPLVPLEIISNLCAKICLATNPYIYVLSDPQLRIACYKVLWGEAEKQEMAENQPALCEQEKEKSS